ncbi:hypothetical protein ACH4YP_47645, partial [Streptomyces sp. NPDC020747]
MSPYREAPAADRVQGTAPSPSPGPEGGWGHPLLDWLLGRRRLKQLDQRHPWLLDTVVVLIVAVIGLTDLLSGGASAVAALVRRVGGRGGWMCGDVRSDRWRSGGR